MTMPSIDSHIVDRRRLERRLNPSRGLVVILMLTLVLVVVAATVIYKSDPDMLGKPALLIFGCMAIGLAFLLMLVDIRFGIGIFTVLSCVSPRFDGNLRGEDLLVPILVTIWGWRLIRGARLTLWTPLTLPLVLVTGTMLFSFLWGISQQTIPNPAFGMSIIIKRLEYVFLFFITLNSIKSREAGRGLLVAFLAGAVLASIIALGGATHDANVGDTRATGLDEDNYNTFAGFLVIAISLAVAGALHYRSRPGAIFGVVAIFLILTLIKTFSREGYAILGISLLTLGLTRYRILIPLTLVVVALAPFVVPASVINRVNDTVGQVQNYQTDSVGSNSMTARVAGWSWRWRLVEAQPILGNGPGSIQFQVDNEYLLRLVESGFLGLTAFLLLLFSCGRYLRLCARLLRGTESEPFVYGLQAAFVGMLLQGTVAAAWSTIRTMEPFWILMGAVGGMVISRSNEQRSAIEPSPLEVAESVEVAEAVETVDAGV